MSGAPGTTPGEWRVEGPASYTNPHMGLWSVEGQTNVANDCTLADAHQLAASSKLYDALEAFVSDCTNEECERCISALAALALARGETV